MDPSTHHPHPSAGAPPMMASGNLCLPKFVDETELDEEEYLADLSRRMANSFLNQDEMLVRSPESTLTDYRIWSPTVTSPPSQISSPPVAAERDESWELLTAAAGQVLRMRLAEQARQQQLKFAGRGMLPQPAKVSPKRSAGTGVYYSPLLAQQQLQVERFYQLRRQQAMKQALAGVRPASRVGETGGVYPRASGVLPSTAPPPLLHHASRPVFLTGTRRESAGTGVFLPRRPATTPTTTPDLRKKPVLSPCPDTRSRQRVLGDFLLDSDAMVPKENRILPQQQFNKYQNPSAADHDKLLLPAEWTY